MHITHAYASHQQISKEGKKKTKKDKNPENKMKKEKTYTFRRTHDFSSRIFPIVFLGASCVLWVLPLQKNDDVWV